MEWSQSKSKDKAECISIELFTMSSKEVMGRGEKAASSYVCILYYTFFPFKFASSSSNAQGREQQVY